MTSQVSAARDFGQAIGAAAVVGAGHHGHAAVGLDRVAHPGVVGGDDDVGDARRPPRRSTTRTIIGRPPRSMSGLPGSRVEA